MKNFIISLLSVIIGTSLLSIAIVNEKFKNNIRVIISLIIAVAVLRGIPTLDLDSFSKDISSKYASDIVFESSEITVEKLVNDSIEKSVRDFFCIDDVEVYSDILIYDDSMEIKSVNVCVATDIELLSIWEFLRNDLKISGDISVTRIKNEGIK